MLTDHWDVSHMSIAVDDLDAAMARYSPAFGIQRGRVLEFSTEGLVLSPDRTLAKPVASPLHGAGASTQGLRQVVSTNGGAVGAEGLPVAGIELSHAEKFSPAHTIWGTRERREYMHHIGYWVDDVESEPRSLTERGFILELTYQPGDVARGFSYMLSPNGIRVELTDRNIKAALGRFDNGGDLDFGNGGMN
jgi:catechol 2,3-dioxygenase-like lactoylglutathione lyase family enzyme